MTLVHDYWVKLTQGQILLGQLRAMQKRQEGNEGEKENELSSVAGSSSDSEDSGRNPRPAIEA